jgi:DNA-binding beta-propeller fold protein YncE
VLAVVVVLTALLQPSNGHISVGVPRASPHSIDGRRATTTYPKLFVSSEGTDEVGVYDARNLQLLHLIADPSLLAPAGLATYGGKLYVANQAGNSISVFDTDSYVYLGSLTGNALSNPGALAIRGGTTPELFVASTSGTNPGQPCCVVSDFSLTASRTGFFGVVAASAAACIGSNLFFTGNDESTLVYHSPTGAMLPSLPQHTVDNHYGIAYGYGSIYITNFASNSVDIYNASTDSYTGTLTDPSIAAPTGVLVAGGRVYVANFSSNYAMGVPSVTVFSVATGKVVPNLYFVDQSLNHALGLAYST